ncbi:MAG: phosphoribosylglycinamide formyltransferase [Oscillospiraceae bacterium]|jgi:phosphoribosylglycinamide formyltransferase-1|nr:phosphoribosylglycinamide formyltransferase [Oscillospiraceae bacterium]
MLKRRVAVFVSGGGTNLQALLDANMPHAEIALVIARRDVYALERAKAYGVPTQIIEGKRAAFEAGALAALCAHQIDVIVLAGFLTILSENFIAHYAGRILNIHPALLPAFGGQGFYGLKVHEAALARGVKLTGATVHLVDATPDGGPILAQKAVAVLPGDTPETLQRRVMEQAEWLLLPQTLEQFCKEMNA